MANNRLHIYCVTCLELYTIAKYYPQQWYCHKVEDVGAGFNAFLEQHSTTCHKGFDGEGMFGMRTENDSDGFLTDYSISPFKLVTNVQKTSVV